MDEPQRVITISIHEAGQLYAVLGSSGFMRLSSDLRDKLRDPEHHTIILPVKLAIDEDNQKPDLPATNS